MVDNRITTHKGTVSVPPHVTRWLQEAFKLIRCGHVLSEVFFQAWLADGRSLEELNEGVVADFLLSSRRIDRATWEAHRSMCIIKMCLGSDPRYAKNIEACAKACQVDLGFAKEAVRNVI